MAHVASTILRLSLSVATSWSIMVTVVSVSLILCLASTVSSLPFDFTLCPHLTHPLIPQIVPVDITTIKTLYVFVDIGIDVQHFIATVRKNFEKGSKLVLVGVIQFVQAIQSARRELDLDYILNVPQAKPLSPAEILGCTSPQLPKDEDALIFVGDGRFHLESIMIHNPDLAAFRYDPYDKKFTRERYDHADMHSLRKHAIETAKKAKRFGLILGTLGRQGSTSILEVHARHC